MSIRPTREQKAHEQGANETGRMLNPKIEALEAENERLRHEKELLEYAVGCHEKQLIELGEEINRRGAVIERLRGALKEALCWFGVETSAEKAGAKCETMAEAREQGLAALEPKP